MRATVVGSGPNGLVGAIRLARAGADVTIIESADRIGGALGSAELTEPGLVHDLGASFLPFGSLSPAFRAIDLEALGVRLRHAPIALAHPLDDGTVGLLHRDLDATATGLGVDGARWQRLFGPITDRVDDLLDDTMRPLLHVPEHPVTTARFGTIAARPATTIARRFRTPQAAALWSGIAAHAFARLDLPFSSAIGTMLTAASHAAGWPVVEGGAQRLTDALVQELIRLGGRIETGRRVTDVRELDDADTVLLGLAPGAAASVLRHALPARRRHAWSRYRHGPAAYKVDYAVDGDIPWRNPDTGRAGVVHLGGRAEEVAATESAVVRGRSVPAPFTLVGQQYVADRTRSAAGLNPVWSYAHVPHGSAADHEAQVTAQIERFAPGFRDRIVSVRVTSVASLSSSNANFVGGDINTGANTLAQLLGRPSVGPDPYATGVPGVYLCSAATPPGPGVHGMAGWNAAGRALQRA